MANMAYCLNIIVQPSTLQSVLEAPPQLNLFDTSAVNSLLDTNFSTTILDTPNKAKIGTIDMFRTDLNITLPSLVEISNVHNAIDGEVTDQLRRGSQFLINRVFEDATLYTFACVDLKNQIKLYEEPPEKSDLSFASISRQIINLTNSIFGEQNKTGLIAPNFNTVVPAPPQELNNLTNEIKTAALGLPRLLDERLKLSALFADEVNKIKDRVTKAVEVDQSVRTLKKYNEDAFKIIDEFRVQNQTINQLLWTLQQQQQTDAETKATVELLKRQAVSIESKLTQSIGTVKILADFNDRVAEANAQELRNASDNLVAQAKVADSAGNYSTVFFEASKRLFDSIQKILALKDTRLGNSQTFLQRQPADLSEIQTSAFSQKLKEIFPNFRELLTRLDQNIKNEKKRVELNSVLVSCESDMQWVKRESSHCPKGADEGYDAWNVIKVSSVTLGVFPGNTQ